MTLIDIILIIVIGAFVIFGLFFGLIHTLGSLVGSVAGIYISLKFNNPLTETFGFLFGGGGAGKVVVFIITYVFLTRIVGLLFYLIEKMMNILMFVPFLGTINRLAGALFGFLEGVIVVSVVVFFALKFLPEEGVRVALEASTVAKYLLTVADVLKVLFPKSLIS